MLQKISQNVTTLGLNLSPIDFYIMFKRIFLLGFNLANTLLGSNV